MSSLFVFISEDMSTIRWAESRQGRNVTTTQHVNLKKQGVGGQGGLVSYEDLLIAQYLDELRNSQKKRQTDRYMSVKYDFFPFAFNHCPNKPWFLSVCSTSLLKTLWEKEKLLVTSNFNFFHSVLKNFLPFSSNLKMSANCFSLDV